MTAHALAKLLLSRPDAFVPEGVYQRLFPDSPSQGTPILILMERGSLKFIVSATRFPGRTDDNIRYFYNEHTCPTNWIGDVELISDDGDVDPHGFMKVVRIVDDPALPDDDINERDDQLVSLFPEVLLSDSTTLSTH
jgi:hypothetical protein